MMLVDEIDVMMKRLSRMRRFWWALGTLNAIIHIFHATGYDT